MLEDNISGICNIIKKYYEDYGEQIENWAILTGYPSIEKLAAYLESKCSNVTKNLKDLQFSIKTLVLGIYIDKTQRPGNVYDRVIEQLGWKIPSNKKNTVFYQFLKNHAPKHEVVWSEIEKYFRDNLEKNINDTKNNLICNIQKLYWEHGDNKKKFKSEIFQNLSSELPDKLVELIAEKKLRNFGEKIYASDIANIIKIYKELNVYESIKRMIDNENLPDTHWILSFWNNTNGINLKEGYESDNFKQLKLRYNSINNEFETCCISKINHYFNTKIDYKRFVNIIEGRIIPKNNTEEIQANFLPWDLIYDNMKFFIEDSMSDINFMTETFKNFTKNYLEPFISLFIQRKSNPINSKKDEDPPAIEIKKDYRGYYCTLLYEYFIDKLTTLDKQKSDDDNIDNIRYKRQLTIITPFLSSLFEYILFPSSERRNRLDKEWKQANLPFNDEKAKEKVEDTIFNDHNNFSLSSISIKEEYKAKFESYFYDDSETNKPKLIYDISKCLIDEFENKKDFAENYKPEICRIYNFGNRMKNTILHREANEIFSKKNISNIDKLRMLFMSLDDFPTTINNIFKYEYLSEKDYEYFSKTGNYDVLDFIDRVYEKCGKDNQGKILRQIKLDDYKPNGQYFSQTIKYLKLPRSFFTEEKSYDILGASGCSRILENCDNLINYTLAMQYNPLFSKDKKAERIYELICCYPSVYKDFISSVQKIKT